MIILAANGTLAGVADAASKVTCTVFGMELNGVTETYATLDQRQLSNSAGTIYTAQSVGPTFIRTITIVNTDTAAHTFQLFVGGTAAANQITPVFSLSPAATAIYEDGVGWQFFGGTNFGGWHPGAMGSSGCKGSTFDRSVCPEVNTTIATTGQIYAQLVWLAQGTLVSTLRFWSATTAASSPTHQNSALYDTSGNRLATGTDLTNGAWAANTLKSFTMQTPYTIPSSGLYYIALSLTASTVPTMKGTTARTNGNLSLASPIVSGVSATTYSTGDMPATISVPSAAVTTSLYAEVA